MSTALLCQALRVDMPAVPKLILIFIADYCTEDGEARPSRSSLARSAGCSETDVSHALNEFYAIGLLTRIGAPVPGRPNRYRLDVDLLARLTVPGQFRHLLNDRGAA